MPTHALRYESPEKVFILTRDCGTHSEQIDHCQISETFTPNTHPDIGGGSYHIVLEAEVTSHDEQFAACGRMIEIAKQLDIAWCYVFGEPWKAISPTVVLSEGPQGWSGNHREVQAAIRRETGNPGFGMVHLDDPAWIKAPFLPLKLLLKARAAYLAASPILHDLIGLHISAHKSPLGKLLMLAKALEVVGRHYGTTRVMRNSKTQQAMNDIGVTPYLKQNVEWLFETANTRFDIRHAVNDKAPGVSLHPKLTTAECRAFEEDATLVVRAFICDQLDLDIYIVPRM